MKKIAIFTMFIFSASIFSCEKNDLSLGNAQVQTTNDIKVIDGRLVFKNYDVFSKIYESLSKKKTDEQQDWAKSYEFTSLSKALENNYESDTYLNKMVNIQIPTLYFSILNAKGEFQIGNDIMWFDKNKRYVAKGEEQLQKIKENPSISFDFFELKPNLIKQKNQNNRINLSVNSKDARHQSQFTIGDFLFKYVHEIYTFSDTYYPTTYTTLNLAIKFEYSKPS